MDSISTLRVRLDNQSKSVLLRLARIPIGLLAIVIIENKIFVMMRKKQAADKKEKLFFKIRDRVYSGYYWPREKLIETDLAAEMKVSRTIIREVLRQLAAKGLVFIEPNKGAFVAELSYQKIKEMVVLEALLEGSAAYIAASRLSSQNLKTLRSELEKSEMIEDPRVWSAHNRAFHKNIITACGNSKLIDVIRDNVGFLRYWFIQLSTLAEIGMRNRSHADILAALESRDATRARDLMEAHVLDSLEGLLRRLQASNPNLLKIDRKE